MKGIEAEDDVVPIRPLNRVPCILPSDDSRRLREAERLEGDAHRRVVRGGDVGERAQVGGRRIAVIGHAARRKVGRRLDQVCAEQRRELDESAIGCTRRTHLEPEFELFALGGRRLRIQQTRRVGEGLEDDHEEAERLAQRADLLRPIRSP